MRKISGIFAVPLAMAASVVAFSAWADMDDLDAIRAATERYMNVENALADGYIPDPSGHCISAEHEGLPAEWGAMGIHYLNPARLGLMPGEGRVNGNGTHTDFMEPAVLLYEPQADGSLELVGVENLVFMAAWEEAGHSGPPMFGDHPWDMMADDPTTDADEAHGFEPHYDLHVWVHRDNPAGPLVPFNAAVACP